jgi:hypothetical protein
MMAAELLPLKALLNPLKSDVVRKGGAEWASVATKAEVTPTMPMVGRICAPCTRETGNSQMDFWSASRFPGSSLRETDRSESGVEKEAADEPGDWASAGAGNRELQDRSTEIATKETEILEERIEAVYRRTRE